MRILGKKKMAVKMNLNRGRFLSNEFAKLKSETIKSWSFIGPFNTFVIVETA
jgi:hypothetical protein